jgi:hypothetical protein
MRVYQSSRFVYAAADLGDPRVQEDRKGRSSEWFLLSPGRSPRVDAIVEHLTPDEQRRYRVYSLMAGGVFVVAITGLSPLLLYLILNLRLHMPGLIAGLVVYVATLCLVLYGFQQRSGSFLKNTVWSKAQGWDKEPL